MAGSAATHVHDLGKLPWLFPSLVGDLPRLADVTALMTAADPSVRPTFSRLRYLLGCLRKSAALSRHKKVSGCELGWVGWWVGGWVGWSVSWLVGGLFG